LDVARIAVGRSQLAAGLAGAGVHAAEEIGLLNAFRNSPRNSRFFDSAKRILLTRLSLRQRDRAAYAETPLIEQEEIARRFAFFEFGRDLSGSAGRLRAVVRRGLVIGFEGRRSRRRFFPVLEIAGQNSWNIFCGLK
jgi:hypothetical protein